MNKPDWKDAPEWAKHLWIQPNPEIFAWSDSIGAEPKALWANDVDSSKNRFTLWPHCWTYVERRP